MVRLLQGDVGCGKTVVAAAAAARAAGSGAQVALMAPTELLAEQHWRNFRDWFEPLGETVALLSGCAAGARARAARSRRSPPARCASWSARTRCSRKASTFAQLALVIVDEQHRFGVQQRLKLREKGRAPAACRTS